MTDPVSKTTTPQADNSRGLLPFKPSVGMVSYRVPDIERSLAFYVGVMGMTELARFPGLGPDERELVLEYPGGRGARLMLMWNVKRSHPYKLGDGYSRITVVVDDAHAAFKHLVAHNAPVVAPVSEANGVLWGVVKDPDGYMIELLQFLRA